MSWSIVFIVILTVGVLLAIYSAILIYKSVITYNWSLTEGKIVFSQIETTTSSSSFGAIDGYNASIRYTYIINEVEYISRRIYYGDKISLGFPFIANSLLNEFTIDKKVDVFYNPQNPYCSVLKKGLHFEVFFALLFGICFALIGASLLFGLL
ncbi:MAG: DUF3592 domain-containing protein [Bacteroidota bacterium]|nr:DUF3592 domain-containing protein [Bacteroidota bacterium]